jgi:hypothetical protein
MPPSINRTRNHRSRINQVPLSNASKEDIPDRNLNGFHHEGEARQSEYQVNAGVDPERAQQQWIARLGS